MIIKNSILLISFALCLTASAATNLFTVVSLPYNGGTFDVTNGLYTNASLIITATPTNDFSFDKWTGDVPATNETDNPLTLILDTNKSIEGVFVFDTVRISTFVGSVNAATKLVLPVNTIISNTVTSAYLTNDETVVISASNTPVEIGGIAWVAGESIGMTVSTNGSVVFDKLIDEVLSVYVTVNFEPDSGSATIAVLFAVNDSAVSLSRTSDLIAFGSPRNVTTIGTVALSQGDEVSVFVENLDGVEDVIVHNAKIVISE